MKHEVVVKFTHVDKEYPKGRTPTYATVGSACFDLYAADDVTLIPGKVTKIPLGVAVEVPIGFEMQIRSRSGLASKGLIMANGIGTIDSDYRGEIMALIYNTTDISHIVEKGDRIAQGTIALVINANFEFVYDLSETDRASGGFGSTGK